MPDIERNGGPPQGQGEIPLTPEMVRFIESLGLYYENFGVPRIGGRMLGLMLLVSAPVSAEQIAATLKISRASVSTNVRMLGMMYLVDQVSLPGDRRDYFVFSPTAWERATQARIEGMRGLQAIGEQGLAALPPDDPARRNLQGMMRWTQRLIDAYSQVLDEWKQQE